MKRILYIPFDHLRRNYGALKDANPKEDVIAFVESARMSQQIFGLKRLSDLPELKERAQEVIAGLQKGKI
jgi:membrane protein required for beta-lactamase induction